MTNKVFKHTPLYRFLAFCNEHESEGKKKILDCGAGGAMPPLSMFNAYGYETTGIELNERAVNNANKYGQDHGQDLGIVVGDMTKLDFEDESFDFVYSYNSVFHMRKEHIGIAIDEMKRVLKPGGLLFVNFLSVDDFRCGEGPDLGDKEYQQMDDDPVIHSYYDYDEGEKHFEGMEFVIKERRIIERIYEGERIKQGFIDYIVKK